MGPEGKTLGKCLLCGKYERLSQQHVRLVPSLKDYRLPICLTCHRVVTRYEDEIEKAMKHVGSP